VAGRVWDKVAIHHRAKPVLRELTELFLDAMRTALIVLFLSTALISAQQPKPDKLFSSAILAQQRGDYATAIQDYQKFLELRPNMVEAKANLGAALSHEGRLDEAIVQYRSALSSSPGNRQIQMNMGLAYYKKGDLTNARVVFDEVNRGPSGPSPRSDAIVRSPEFGHSSALLTNCHARRAQRKSIDERSSGEDVLRLFRAPVRCIHHVPKHAL
jgi:tetratricopeptide (TPR) repeat protein